MVVLADQQFDAPVPRNSVRIRGDFAGTVTTATHCLEVALPLDYQIPIAAIEPAVAAFIKAETAAFDGYLHDDNKPELAQVWKELREIIADAPSMMEEIIPGNGRLADVSAKDELISELVAKLDTLKVENTVLKDELARVAGSLENAQASKDMGDNRKESRIEHNMLDCGRGAASAPVQIENDSVWLDGSFSGTAQTRKHFLDIALPIRGLIPGARALELLDGLGELTESDRTSSAQSTWEQLSELLADTIPEEMATRSDTSQRAHRALKEKLAKAMEEKSKIESEMLKMQLQVENLRSTNSSLVGYLATAEHSATQLRSSLRHTNVPAISGSPLRRATAGRRLGSRSPSPRQATGTSPRSFTPPRNSPREAVASASADAGGEGGGAAAADAQESDAALVADLRELERWARELRTLDGAQ